jgi:glycine reductase
VKHIDAAGIPIVHICTVTPISLSVGANRVVPGISIPHPVGQPSVSPDEELEIRKEIVKKAIFALGEEVTEQTIF